MNPRIFLVLSFIFGVAACAAILATYFYGGNFGSGFSSNNEDWGAFGSYLGGVLGSLFGFFSFMLLLATVLQQEQQLERMFEEGLKQNHLNYMSAINEDIRYLLERKINCTNDVVLEFGDFFLGSASEKPIDAKVFGVLISKLLKYLAEYSNALHLYRDNFDSYFQYRAHKERAIALAEFIKSHEGMLSNMEPVTLGVIFHTIEGGHENA